MWIQIMAWKKIDLYTAQHNPLWKEGSAKIFNILKSLLIFGNILDILSVESTNMKIQSYLSSKTNQLVVETPDTSLITIILIIFTIFLIWFPKLKKHSKAAEILIAYVFIKKIILFPLIFIILKDYVIQLNLTLMVISGILTSLIFSIILFSYSRVSKDYRLNHKLEIKV